MFPQDIEQLPIYEIILRLGKMVTGWKRHYGFLNPVEEFSQINSIIEELFVNFTANRISQGHWSSDIPDNEFPLLTTDNAPNMGLKKLNILWKQAIDKSKALNLEKTKKTVEKKVSKKRQKYRREHALNGDLIVTTPGCFIGKRDERIIVRIKQKIAAEVSCIKLKNITVSSKGVALSGDVIDLCIKKNISIHFADKAGRITAVITSPGGVSGDISLLQVKERNSERGIHLARMFVLGKVKNQLALLKYYYKYRVNHENGFGKTFTEREPQIRQLIDKIKSADSCDEPETFRQQLMGLEGSFATHYWTAVKHLFKNGIIFEGRKRQGARDFIMFLRWYTQGKGEVEARNRD